MDPEKARQIRSKGGKARAAAKVGHFFTHEEAVAAGRKSARAVHRRKRKKKPMA